MVREIKGKGEKKKTNTLSDDNLNLLLGWIDITNYYYYYYYYYNYYLYKIYINSN